MSSPPKNEPRPSDDGTVLPWQQQFQLAIPHGIAVGIALPGGDAAPPAEVLQRLHPKERATCGELEGLRRVQWAGGRLALQLALKRLRSRRVPFLRSEAGGVDAPQGLSASVSHKRDLVVGLVGQASAGTLGVDLENRLPERNHLAPRILTDAERERWEAIPPERRWPVLLAHFSVKESIYKAIHPFVQRYVGFHEAELVLRPNGRAEVTMHLSQGEGPFEIEASFTWLDDHLLTTARIRPGAPSSG